MGMQSGSTHLWVLEKLDKLEFNSILDIGCGTGTLLSLIMSKNSNINVSGIDLSSEMIKLAAVKLGEVADLRDGDSEELPWDDNSFEIVVSTHSFHHYPNPSKVIDEMYRVLKPDGYLIITDAWSPTPLRQIINFFMRFDKGGDVRFYSEKEICNLVKLSGFNSIEWTPINTKAFILSAVSNK